MPGPGVKVTIAAAQAALNRIDHANIMPPIIAQRE